MKYDRINCAIWSQGAARDRVVLITPLMHCRPRKYSN